MAKHPRSIPVPPLTDEMFERGRKTLKRRPYDAIEARYNRKCDAVELSLRCGIMVRIPRRHMRELVKAPLAEVAKIKIQPGGDGISFPSIDVDVDVAGLLADELGGLFARAMGRRTRGRTSEKKAAASRENGRKGGRPRKSAA